MKRVLMTSMVAATCIVVSFAAHAQQRGAPPAAAPAATTPSEPTPRMADGRPDLSGVWWTGGDVGSRGYRGGVGSRDGSVTFTSLYNPATAEAAKKLSDRHDPTLRCIPTAFGTLNVSMFDVGAVAQVIANPKFVVFLSETFHGYRVVPTDGRKHREDIPPSYRGDAVGRWEGDVFVMETRNFTDDTWMWAEGLVSPHSDQLRIVERYNRVNKNTLEIEATIYDPKVLTGPLTVPKKTLVLAPFDQILPLICSGVETQGLMDGAAKQKPPTP
jgi:hypothetical protein